MERVNRILAHPLFRESLGQIEEAERERIYCKHDMRHFLDTARLAWIANMEQGLNLDKEIVYAAALLHDIGRAKQYARGEPHDKASAELIRCIMQECGFSVDETVEVATAVEGHCQSYGKHSDNKRIFLGRLLQEADHASRNCFCCGARESCSWPNERKNLALYN